VLALARPKDAVTLWHLLSRVSVDQRDRVFDRLTEFVPPPASVTREGIRKGRQRHARRLVGRPRFRHGELVANVETSMAGRKVSAMNNAPLERSPQ
jgi:hypothetical protein